MIYAPIIIPTCNRIEHLKRCIHSLQNNEWAKYTDLYISLDYPPNDSYIGGYQKVKNYLKEDIKCFKSVNISYQESNLGPKDNFIYLTELIQKKYDRWIFSEDDNEFSPNFIEFIDKGLMLFQDDDRVLAVCGTKDINWPGRGTSYRSSYFQPYGYGIWRYKYQAFRKGKEEFLLSADNQKIFSICKLFYTNHYLFKVYVDEILCNNKKLFWENTNKLNPIDGVIQLYIYYTDMCCIFPTVQKSRTWGNDGSGFTMSANNNINPERDFPLDREYHFEYKGCEAVVDRKISVIMNKQYRLSSLTKILKAWIKYFIFRVLGKSWTLRLLKRV